MLSRAFFIEAEFQHDGIDDLIVTSDMAERKAKMIELGDAFIAPFPVGRARSRRLPRSCPPCRWGISMRLHFGQPERLQRLRRCSVQIDRLFEPEGAFYLLCRRFARDCLDYQRISLGVCPTMLPMVPLRRSWLARSGHAFALQ